MFVLNRKKGNNRCRIGRGSGRNPRHVIEYVFGRISSGRNAWTGFGKVTRIIHTSIGNALPDQSEWVISLTVSLQPSTSEDKRRGRHIWLVNCFFFCRHNGNFLGAFLFVGNGVRFMNGIRLPGEIHFTGGMTLRLRAPRLAVDWCLLLPFRLPPKSWYTARRHSELIQVEEMENGGRATTSPPRLARVGRRLKESAARSGRWIYLRLSNAWNSRPVVESRWIGVLLFRVREINRSHLRDRRSNDFGDVVSLRSDVIAVESPFVGAVLLLLLSLFCLPQIGLLMTFHFL